MSKLLQVDSLGNLKDRQGRTVALRGINLDASSKMPTQIPTTFINPGSDFWDGDDVSFIDRPFTLKEAPAHLERLKSWGFNTIRYIFTWEALEHKGPGIYDDEYISYTIDVLKLIDSYGFYVFLDPHQDVWSRFCGGSGAPLWTLYAFGLEPRNFEATAAALIQNLDSAPEEFPKMIWPTNYTKLANQVAFTLFFAGKDFAPNAIIDNQNIDDYLQSHLLNALLHFYSRIASETSLLDSSIFGFESMNEPNPTLIGYADISVLPEEQKLRKGLTPTAFQAMLLGSGVPCDVDTFEFNTFGSKKTGTQHIDPDGVSAWVQDDSHDKHYGFNRHPDWELGRCIWAQNGVWDDDSNTLLMKDYFSKVPSTGQPIDEAVFVNTYWTRFWNKFYFAFRERNKDIYLLAQPPIFALPPDLKDSAFIDDRVIYTPHYYDGLTLVQKHWSNAWNIDMLGVLRGRYATPAFAIRLGSTAIRNCLRDQLKAMRQEGIDHMGHRPCLMSETGMPFDLDNCKAYESGDYSSQQDALDALGFALEGSQLHHTLWTYCSYNSHRFGDKWNGEDFSVFSASAHKPFGSLLRPSASSLSLTSESSDYTLNAASPATELTPWAIHSGMRAQAAIARPYPVAMFGDIESFGFDLKTRQFSLSLDADNCLASYWASQIVLPDHSFPDDNFIVSVSAGKWEFDEATRILSWWHPSGEQSIEVTSQAPAPVRQNSITAAIQTYLGYFCSCCGVY